MDGLGSAQGSPMSARFPDLGVDPGLDALDAHAPPGNDSLLSRRSSFATSQ